MKMDITLGARNEVTKRFNFVRGADNDVSFDDTEAHAVMTSVMEDKASCWYDPTHGSDLFLLENLTSRTPSQAEAMILDALTPLEAGAIVNPVAEAKAGTLSSTGGGTLNAKVRWTTPGGVDGEAETVL